MTKVTLIYPSQRTAYYGRPLAVYPPLGLLLIAAVLRDCGAAVTLIDVDAEGLDEGHLAERLRDGSPDIVGISALTPSINAALRAARTAKESAGAVTVLGGIHPTVEAETCIRDPHVDVVVRGEGERTMAELFEQLRSHKPDLAEVKGICYKVDGRVERTPDRELEPDLDSLPFPAVDLVPDLEAYRPPNCTHFPAMQIMTTRGCPGQCTFCAARQVFGRRVRARSIDNVIQEIVHLRERFGIREVHIMDDCFTYSKPRTLEFCRRVQALGHDTAFAFPNGVRADRVDEETLRALRGIGVNYIGFGVESGSQEVLDAARKGTKLDRVRDTFAIARELGFVTWGFFIIGLVRETAATVRQTIRFAKELDPHYAKFLILKPYPGSEVFHELQRRGLIFDTNYDSYGIYGGPVHRLDGMDAKAMVKWQRRAMLEFYLRPRKIWQLLTSVRSAAQWRLLWSAAKLAKAVVLQGLLGKR